jgi:DNA repair exonuclease SbcCD nuclease subunit
MSKYVLFSDLHLGVHDNSTVWLDASLLLVREVIDAAVKASADGIVFLGDFFHDRRSINVKTLAHALRIGELLEGAGVPSYLVIGNHDCYYKNHLLPSSLEIFDGLRNVTVVKENLRLDGQVTLNPWNIPFDDVTSPVLMGHFGIQGCKMNEGHIDKESALEVPHFKRFSLVLSGHFHTPSRNRNIAYIGSCMPFTFHDVDSPRGYYLYDGGELAFTEFTSCPKYKVVYSNEEVDPDALRGNVVKIVYTEELSKQKGERLMERIAMCKPLFIHTDFKSIRAESEATRDDCPGAPALKTTQELMVDFVSKTKVPDFIEPKMLRGVISQLFAQVKSREKRDEQ